MPDRFPEIKVESSQCEKRAMVKLCMLGKKGACERSYSPLCSHCQVHGSGHPPSNMLSFTFTFSQPKDISIHTTNLEIMTSQKKKGKFEEIPVELIDIGTEQVRLRAVDKDLADLAVNIKQLGLINPITVFQREGKYVLIEGQRRLLAVKELGWKEITAKVIPPITDPVLAKAYSFSENFLRQNLVRKDVIDACTAFYNRYGSMKAVAEELGLPYNRVRKFVLYDRLPKKMKQMVNDNKVSLDHALKATDAATSHEGDVDVGKAQNLANEMKALTSNQKQTVVEVAKANPAASADEIIEKAKKPKKIVTLRITLAVRHYESLKKVANELGIDEGEAAVRGVIEWLTREGY